MREVRRLAKITGVDDARLGLILELAAAAGLIASGIPDPQPAVGDPPYWAPTVAADRFSEASAARTLASAGHHLARLGGQTGADRKPRPGRQTLCRTVRFAVFDGRAVGSPSAAEHAGRTAARCGSRQEHRVGGADLASAPVVQAAATRADRRPSGRSPTPRPGRPRRDQHARPRIHRWRRTTAAAIAAMARALPAPIDHFLVQADLTVVVPGPLERHLAEELSAVATVESAGTAMVYRVSETSIRHALDVGKTADELHSLFRKHSKTPVPQGLTYLIDDVARRHGQLRVGMAASFVRCEDPALLAQAAAAAEHSRPALARSDRGDFASTDQRSAFGPAGRRLRPGRRGLDRDHRRHPKPWCAGSHPAAPSSASADSPPEQRHPERGGRRAAKSDRRTVRQRADRPGRGDVTAAAGRSGTRHGADQLRRCRRGGHAAGGVADRGDRRAVGRVRLGVRAVPASLRFTASPR